MDLDNIFGQNQKHSKRGYGHNQQYGNKHHDDHGHYNEQNKQSYHTQAHHSEFDFANVYLDKIKNNPKLKMLLIVGGIGIVLILIVVIALLFPLIMKLFQYISENGIEGIVNTIWKGSK